MIQNKNSFCDWKLKFEKLAMNTTGSKAGSFVVICPMNEMVWKQEYQVEKVVFAMTAIILNILSFPVTILMNALVIMAVKTRTRLQSKYNILLACLAGTVSRSSYTANFHCRTDLRYKRFISD